MTNKVYVVTGNGPGDDGKGGVVQKIATMRNAHTIIKVGGAQGSHGVCTSGGECFAFSQWGCGTFDGIRTHISSCMIVSPEGLLNEAEALRYQFGIRNVFDLLTVDEEALCATHYHRIASHLKEMARGNNPRGTIGTGVGEAYRCSQRHPELAIRVRDLLKPGLKNLLYDVRRQIQLDLAPVIGGEFLPSDRDAVKKEIFLLNDDGYLDFVSGRFEKASKLAAIVDHDYLRREVLAQEGVAVIESSHGVLTDRYYGFEPHTSAIRTLPRFRREMLKDADFQGEVVDIGVSRAYAFRHGYGPLPTADPEMSKYLLPGSHKGSNRFQGEMRAGPLDIVLLRYSIEVCGGESAFGGLAITWFDQILKNGEWRICDSYFGADDKTYFLSQGKIRVRRGEDEEQLRHQENLGKQLLSCRPEITVIKVPLGAGRDEFYSFCADILYEKLGVPVRMVSFGPTELDKVCR